MRSKTILVVIISLIFIHCEELSTEKINKNCKKDFSLPTKIHLFILKMIGQNKFVESCKIIKSDNDDDDPYFKQLEMRGNSKAYWGPATTISTTTVRLLRGL
jgi:nicotinic acid phosphoribosyltransferase